MINFECVVIGAGVVGLATARALQAGGREVLLLEKERSFGTETSSRNSEVIHAGIYYEAGTVKARTCVRGKELLYEYCTQRGIPHRRLGKIIVAVAPSEISTLETYVETAVANGVDDLMWLDGAQVKLLEPEVFCTGALLSPSTGIIDSHVYMQTLLGDFESLGGTYISKATVNSGYRARDGIRIEVDDGDVYTVAADAVVNSGGLHAAALASRFRGIREETLPIPHYAIGHYYAFLQKSPFSRLVYPVASKGGLGIHATLDMAGTARFGPDVRWRKEIDYAFDDSRLNEFASAIRTYYPGLCAEALRPGYTGIRPKIAGPNDPPSDFVVQTPDVHGVEGLINLFGIESPGLTASLAIAEEVASLIPS